jgi:hypothetical protein
MATGDATSVEQRIQQAAASDLSRADVQQILDQLARHLGIAALTLDGDGSAELLIDDEVPLTLIHLPGFPGLVVSAPLPDAPGARGDLLLYLLQANMSWTMTRGGAFGILPAAGPGSETELRLCRHLLLADRDLARIDRELGTFVDDLIRWTEEIDLYLDSLDGPDQDATGQALEPTPDDGPQRPPPPDQLV